MGCRQTLHQNQFKMRIEFYLVWANKQYTVVSMLIKPVVRFVALRFVLFADCHALQLS